MEAPLYGGTKVETQPLPNARLNAEAPSEAFGGNIAAVATRGVHGIMSEVSDIAQHERAKAVDTMTQDGFSKIIAKKNELLYDPKQGAFSKKGKDAFSVPEVYGKQFNDYAAQVEKDMPDPQAREIFKKMSLNQKVELDTTLSHHVSQQAEALKDETFKGLMSTMTDDAVSNFDQDPKKVGNNLKIMKAAADNYAADKGLTGTDTQPLRDEMWKQITNKLHTGVINRMVSMGEPDAARSYFEANKADISGMDMDNLERQIKKTDVLKQKDNYLVAGKVLDQAGPGSDPAMVVPGFTSLNVEQRDALKRRFDNQQSPTANHDFYALTQQEVAGLDRAEFETKYWSRFDQEHKQAAETYWQAATDAVRGGRADVFKSIRGDKDMITAALRNTGLVPATGKLEGDAAETQQRFEDYIDDKFKTFAHDEKRNPKDEEKQDIIHKALLDTVYKRGFFTDTKMPRGVMTADQLKSAYTPIADIGRGDRLALVNLARAQGIIKGPEKGGPNDDRATVLLQRNIERAYAAAAGGNANKETIISIMKGQ